MATQYSTALRNNQLDQIAATISTGGTLEIYSGAQPANCAAARTGTLLASISLPNPFLAAASGGSASLTGTWQDASADATGQPGYYSFESSGGTCHAQGPATMPWAASTAFSLGTCCVNGGNVYRVTTAGTSAGSGGPTGTGTGITDGTVTWAYVSANTDSLNCASSMAAGASFTVTSFAFAAGNA